MKFSVAALVLVVMLATTNAASLSGEEAKVEKVEEKHVVKTRAAGDEPADVQLEGEEEDEEEAEEDDEDDENVWLRDGLEDEDEDEEDEEYEDFEDGEPRFSEDDEEDEDEFEEEEEEEVEE